MFVKDLHNEENILAHVSEGNESAFRLLVQHYTLQLAPYILKFARSKEKTEEIIQDVFLQIWMSREALSNISNFRSYLFVVSRNHALNSIRNSLREEKRHRRWVNESSDVSKYEMEDHLPDLSIIEEAIKQLPPQQQRVWLLSRRHGKKYKEIAEEISISKETVKKYIQYANCSIATFLKKRLDLIVVLTLFFKPIYFFITDSPLL
ncbi:MAG TPA: sigma-70 family RNA polymerase sigma factor [Chitinophagaceae bacterium]|nr:sigma-70 family RNA polymerase sigma factor [Chitinophagaceae bacterium]